MHCRTIVTSVVLSLLLAALSGCLGSEHLSTRTPDQPSAHEAMTSLRVARPHYTSNARAAVKPEVFFLIVSDTFSVYERAQILRAVSEWNVALNGFVRFEFVAGKALPKTQGKEYWAITAKQGREGPGTSTILGATYFAPGVGGVMDVYVQRVGKRDLGAIVMHELGHVLGLGHSAKASLMAAHYHPTSQRCVDRTAVEAVAAKRGLPLARLNWCADD